MASAEVLTGNETSESPPPLCVLFALVDPTLDLSDTFYDEQTWSDKQGPTVYTYIYHIAGDFREVIFLLFSRMA